MVTTKGNNMFYVNALDSRDRAIFGAGPYMEKDTAIAAADDWAGSQALATFKAEGLNLNEHSAFGYGSTLRMDGVLINRATVFDGTDMVYDTAMLAL